MPGFALAEYELDPASEPWYQRYEHSRRDYLLSLRGNAPLLASQEWPEPPPPRERRVRFYLWRQ